MQVTYKRFVAKAVAANFLFRVTLCSGVFAGCDLEAAALATSMCLLA